MESSTHRLEAEEKQQAELRKQIAALQAQLKPTHTTTPCTPPPPKRQRPTEKLLVAATPSPKKRKLSHSSQPQVTKATAAQTVNKVTPPIPPKPGPSNFLSGLSKITSRLQDDEPDVARSSGFSEPCSRSDVTAPKRDDRLALIEDLEPGPYEHKPLANDPDFAQLEPHSDIRLSTRTVPHSDICEYLRGRFYLSPSRLYSAIRLLPDKQTYDVPVPGDWVTIAVVAERGPVKFSKPPVGIEREAGDPTLSRRWKGKAGEGEGEGPRGKKYVTIKLIDFGARSRSTDSSTGGKSVIRGDAFLNMLLFEADSFEYQVDPDGKRQKIYKGGSRGAFEAMSKLKEGDVIAMLNPRVLRPFQRSSSPHPVTNILALNPTSASSIFCLGRARDLGMCAVLKKDGKVCGSWCDKRVSEVCEYHVLNAVEKSRAGRSEFAVGTSGMRPTAAPKKKPTYDPHRQWGLKPETSRDEHGSATYFIAGHAVGGSNNDPASLFVGENMGRGAQAKAARKQAQREMDKTLEALLGRDKEGMKAVVRAREVADSLSKSMSKVKEKDKKRKDKDKDASKEKGKEDGAELMVQKNSYSASVIKSLGFDPLVQAGHKRANDDQSVQKKLQSLAEVQNSRKRIILSARPGERIRSGVSQPVLASSSHLKQLPSLDDSGDELPDGITITDKFVDLDDF